MPQKNGEGREKAKASGGIQTPDVTKPVESANDVVVIVQVEDEVLSHDGQADDADVGAEKTPTSESKRRTAKCRLNCWPMIRYVCFNGFYSARELLVPRFQTTIKFCPTAGQQIFKGSGLSQPIMICRRRILLQLVIRFDR